MTTAEAADGITLTGSGGLSLTVPDFFAELRERESAEVPLVAGIDGAEGFRPTVTVGVEASTPQLASIEQLSAGAVERQLDLGRLVVAVDVWPVEGQDDGRRVISLYAAGAETVLQLQYLTVRSGQAITLSLEVLASAHHFGLEVFRYVTGTLRCDGPADEVPPSPSPDSVAEGDVRAASRGVTLEDLGDIRSRQRFHTEGPSLDADDVKALRASLKRSRRGREALIAAGLVQGDGQLTGIGSTVHDLLARSRAQLTAEVVVPGRDEPSVLEAFLRDSDVAVLADPPPGGVGAHRTLDVIPGLTLPVTLARWLGLAPAWTVEIATPPDAGVSQRPRRPPRTPVRSMASPRDPGNT